MGRFIILTHLTILVQKRFQFKTTFTTTIWELCIKVTNTVIMEVLVVLAIISEVLGVVHHHPLCLYHSYLITVVQKQTIIIIEVEVRVSNSNSKMQWREKALTLL